MKLTKSDRNLESDLSKKFACFEMIVAQRQLQVPRLEEIFSFL